MSADPLAIVLQLAAVAFSLSGTWVTGNRHVAGPALTAASGAVFVVLNVFVGLWIVAALSALSVIVNLRNVVKWWRLA